MTQRELAKEVGLPQWHIFEIENDNRIVSKEMAKRFTEVLRVALPG